MTWILFDESDHRVPTPGFCLKSARSEEVCLQQFKEDCNVLLLFAGKTARTGGPGEYLPVLERFAERWPEYQSEETRLVTVFPNDAGELSTTGALAGLPFTLLSDADESARHTYAGLIDASLTRPEDDLLFVLDRYLAPYAALVTQTLDDPSIQDDILSWVRYIGVQCPE